ncbi:MAG: amidohydrolase family protein [Clostridia bacterium]|nr:amidohydrolase family protein [Clostridia bacterium]
MEKIFDAHVHYLFEIPIDETIELFKREFEMAGSAKYNFLSIPFNEHANGYEMLYTQNIKGLFLKKTFSPNAYAFSGLEHPKDLVYTDFHKKDFLRQAEEYIGAGFDGFKMLEGYPVLRKLNQIPLDDKVYDYFYEFCQENGLPLIMHVANPKENWDISKASEYAIKTGRVCDHTYPTKEKLTEEVYGILKKFPKLKLTLAHFGFMCYDVKDAEKYLNEYENTMFDLTPGGEQLLMQASDWDTWSKFYDKYQDRIIYGTDFYAFPLE